jgi:hypothetical protein
MRDTQNATHFIISRNRINLMKSDRKPNWKLEHILNLKFIFHSFFFIKKMDEHDSEYTELF